MSTQSTVLLVGGTGRTGGRVLRQLLDRGAAVRAIVRARARLPPGVAEHPALTVIEGSVLSLPEVDLRRHVRGCDAVVSCLGHIISVRGVLGPPWMLVTRAVTRLCRAIEAEAPVAPVKLVLMSSVSVHRARSLDGRRGWLERAVLVVLRALMPPARDNQRAADFLRESIGTDHPAIAWCAVRPDSLQEGESSEYAVHDALVDSMFKPGHTRMANVAHFMAELVTVPMAWERWRGKLPVIVDVAATA